MAKRKPPPLPTDGELRILQVLWDLGPATVRQVVARLPGTGYTTALKLLQIMHQKKLVHRDESGHAHLYTPASRREDFERHAARDLAQRAFGGSAARLAVQALSAQGATPEELAEIRRLLDQLEADES